MQQSQPMPHHQEHAHIPQHASQPGLPIPIHHPISVSIIHSYTQLIHLINVLRFIFFLFILQQLFAIDPHGQQTIKTENDKFYHFPTHSMGKPQILSDTKLPPSQMFDVRNADGQIVHVNIEDINQFLTYHEVFGKIGNTDHAFPSGASTLPPINPAVPVSNAQTTPIPPSSINQTNSQSQSAPLIIPKIENLNTSAPPNSNTISVGTTSNVANNTTTATCVTAGTSDDSSAMPSPGMHTCDICGKVFAFKYQFIGKKFRNWRKKKIFRFEKLETK